MTILVLNFYQIRQLPGLDSFAFLSFTLTIQTGVNEAFGFRIRVFSLLYLHYLKEKKRGCLFS